MSGLSRPNLPPEIEPLLKGLERIPGTTVIDPPAILRRHPEVCLFDGLAYDNPPGSKHAHRWQDVDELLSRYFCHHPD